jgi:hypothetical protein
MKGALVPMGRVFPVAWNLAKNGKRMVNFRPLRVRRRVVFCYG